MTSKRKRSSNKKEEEKAAPPPKEKRENARTASASEPAARPTEKVLDQVDKLLAMTASDFQEEARTAALILAQMIRKHDLVIVPKTDCAAAPEYSISTLLYAVDGLRIFSSQYEGWCRRCGKPYKKGDAVLWKRESGTTHTAKECIEYWLQFAAPIR